MSFVFYDVETTGVDKRFDQILQFAAIRTDHELNEIDRFELRCQLLPHVVPSPGALVVTRVGIDRIVDPALPTHYEMVCEVVERLGSWSPSVFLGWNTLEFDEDMLRQALYQCLHIPYLTNTGGNARTDLLKVARTAHADVPTVLALPYDERGRPTFKLDRLAPANGFAHAQAHDALADVEATIHICRLIEERAPDHWSDAIRFSSKAAVLAFVEAEDAYVLSECYFGKVYRFALMTLAVDPANSSSVLAYDLTVDPGSLLGLDDEALAWRLARSPKPVRRIRANACPMLRDLASFGDFGGMTVTELQVRAARVGADTDLHRRLILAAGREPFEKAKHVEARIYDGFPSRADSQRMAEFHASGCWNARARIVESFEDPRFVELGRRLIFHHAPEALAAGDRQAVAAALAARVLGHGHGEPPWTTVSSAAGEANTMALNCGDAERLILGPLQVHYAGEEARCRALLGLG